MPPDDWSKVVDRKVADISERYEVGDMLGEGRFSQVYAATRGKQHYALKAVDLGMLEEDEEAVEALVQETTALRRAYAASSKHVPKLHEVVQTEDERLFVVMDQVRGCELFEMLDQGSLSESSARRLIAQLLSALSALHRQHVVHRDVKPENLMVSDIDDPAKCRLVMIDFGYAALEAPDDEGLSDLAGSPEYAAPEVLSWLDGEGEAYTKACDMWSVGVTAYVLLTGELPFDLPDEGDLERHVRETPPKFSQDIWDDHPDMVAAKEFVLDCMKVAPSARLTAQQALKHAWFAPRPDDSQSVAIGASLAAFASLQRRVAGLSVADAPRRVRRWMGKLTGLRKGSTPTKQMFWELKLGMPPVPEEQDQSRPPPDLAAAAKAEALASLEAQRSARESQREALKRPADRAGGQLLPLPLAPLARSSNTPAEAPPAALASAKKLIDRLDTDRAEEERIKQDASPRASKSGAAACLMDASPRASKISTAAAAAAAGSENPLPSPRRALFLAPSPRRQEQMRLDALAKGTPQPATPNAAPPPTPFQLITPAPLLQQTPRPAQEPAQEPTEMQA